MKILILFLTAVCCVWAKPNLEIEEYIASVKTKVENTVNQIVSIPQDERNFENTVTPLNLLNDDIVETIAILTFFSQADEIENFKGFLYQTLSQRSDLAQEVISYCLEGKGNDFQRYEMQKVLESAGIGNAIGLPSYEFLKGNASDKVYEDQLSVLNLNVCFLPGNHTYFFGGMTPWQERIDGIAEKIKSVDADVVCLQEVFVQEAGHALFDRLKDQYGYFYTAIGPKLLGFNLQSIGFPSCLFVASKYPLENPRFTLFSNTIHHMDYGYFDFTIHGLHLYTTHLSPMDSETRALQLQQIIDEKPQFLCGDLNIPWNGTESRLIRENFITKNENGYTYTNYHEKILFDLPIETQYDILDYALLTIDSDAQLETTIVEMDGLSDHHGLLSVIR